MATEKIIVQIGEKVIELKGADKEAFLTQRSIDQKQFNDAIKRENQLKVNKVSAYTKLGLTEEEINAIL